MTRLTVCRETPASAATCLILTAWRLHGIETVVPCAGRLARCFGRTLPDPNPGHLHPLREPVLVDPLKAALFGKTATDREVHDEMERPVERRARRVRVISPPVAATFGRVDSSIVGPIDPPRSPNDPEGVKTLKDIGHMGFGAGECVLRPEAAEMQGAEDRVLAPARTGRAYNPGSLPTWTDHA